MLLQRWARPRARVLALQALYEINSVEHETEAVIARLLANTGLSEENATFTRELVSGVMRNKDKIDQTIQSFAPLLSGFAEEMA